MSQETWIRRPDGINRGWRYNIPAGPVIDRYQADGDITAAREGLAAAARGARDFAAASPAGEKLREIVEDLADAEDERELEYALGELYDWGDAYRVIIH